MAGLNWTTASDISSFVSTAKKLSLAAILSDRPYLLVMFLIVRAIAGRDHSHAARADPYQPIAPIIVSGIMCAACHVRDMESRAGLDGGTVLNASGSDAISLQAGNFRDFVKMFTPENPETLDKRRHSTLKGNSLA
jgi:hypothetical protein